MIPMNQARGEKDFRRNLKMPGKSETAASAALMVWGNSRSDLSPACGSVLFQMVQSRITEDNRSTMREDTLDNGRGEWGIVSGNSGE